MQWFLVNDRRDAQILFYVFISIYNSLHVSSTSCSSSGETNCVNTTSGNCRSVLVAVSCAGLMTYASAECTVENSWWWTEELPKTCRVSWQNKFGKLMRLLVLLKRNNICVCVCVCVRTCACVCIYKTWSADIDLRVLWLPHVIFLWVEILIPK